jgi:hypothetical protein
VKVLLTAFWRFATGQHMDGRKRSDATFWRPGTSGGAHWWGVGEASRWARMSGSQRFAVRFLGVDLVIGWLWYRALTEHLLVLILGPGLGVLIFKGRQSWYGWEHRRELVQPTAAALAPFLAATPRTVQDGMTIEPGFADAKGGEHVLRLQLPDEWPATPDLKARVEQVIEARLGIDVKWSWQTAKYPMFLTASRSPVPPSEVPLLEVLSDLRKCPASKVLLGRSADGSLHYWDRANEDPHIAIHGGSRRGKTSLLLSLAAQDLARGGMVTAIDPKRISLIDLAGLRGVTLCNNPRDLPAMWAAVREFREMVEDRFDQLERDPTVEFPVALLLIDELSMFSAMSAALWRKVKEKGDPAVPEVWADVAACVWLAAQVHGHVVVAGQRLDYAVLGGMLGSFGVRMLAGYQQQDYARLVGQTPFLRSQKPRGRFLLYEGGELTWLQLVFGEPEAWRDYALAALRGPQGAADLAAKAGTGTGDIVGLAAGAAFLGMSFEAFKRARFRRPVPGETTAPSGQPAWTGEVLTAWREARPSIIKGEVLR